MKRWHDLWKDRLHSALSTLYKQAGLEFSPSLVLMEVPPKPEMGDLAFPMFPHARALRLAPPLLARQMAEALGAYSSEASAVPLGPYVNLHFSRGPVGSRVLSDVARGGDQYGRSTSLADRRVMLEFSSPNTNKPLHIGHLRNNTLGEATSRILRANGAQVHKVCLLNDRGINICRSMLAYTKFFAGKTPDTEGVKSDRFVGDAYVKFGEWAATDPTAEEQAQALLLKWEAGDPSVHELWKTMNAWAFSGVSQTYARQGIGFDRFYRESETWQLGKDVILQGLKAGIFRSRDDGAVVVDLPWVDHSKEAGGETNAVKVLLRPDGTSIYMTQDLGTAIARHADWEFNQLVYVVASEQDYHFQVLFHCLSVLGYDWSKNLFHLSYGMVKLPDGSRIKSRQGTTADADDILDDLEAGALEEIRAKGREEELEDAAQVSASIAKAALHYFLLQATPGKDMIFDAQESLSFNGNTGPYLQYMGARLSALLAKAPTEALTSMTACDRLTTNEEWELVKLLANYPELVIQAGRGLDPSILAGFAYELAKSFARFYHDLPVLNAPEPELIAQRVQLCASVLQVLKNVFELLNIPFLRSM
ncbi:MAG: arginine--tRNA ligase [Spirochaetales bacterium]